jgi:hypothetical protein
MSHVDEGALHAYLDGALDEYPAAEARRVREHVETCAVCAERLADERRVREEAGAILDLAAPKVEVPTFEELRAYVRAGQSKRAASSRLYRMSWAASVVLALGTGWMIRGSRIDPVPAFEAQRESVTVGSDANTVGTVAPPPAAEEAERDVPAEPPAEISAESRRISEPQPTPATTFERAAAAPTVVSGRAEVAQSQLPPAVTGPAADADGVANQLAAAGARSEPARDDSALGGGAGAAFGDAVASVDELRLSDARIQERIDSAARVAEARRRVAAGQADQTVTSALDAAASPAPAMQRARAANEVQKVESEASLVVPGFAVLDVLPVSEGTAFAGVRALQRLENGDTLEVVHLPEGVDPSLLPPPAPGRTELVRQTPEGWLVMRAPRSLAYLEQLLERLQAGR